MKRITRRAGALAAALACLVALAATAAGAGDGRRGDRPLRPIVKTRKIAPGLLFTRIIERQIPRRTFVLKVDPSRPVTVDVTLAGAALPARRTTSEMAKAHDALAATNGEFSFRTVGRPVHPFAQDGDLVQTAGASAMFGFRRDEQDVYLGRPDVRVTATDRDSGQTWRLDRWNRGSPAPGEIAGFSPVGGTLEFPPPYACSARLLPEGPPAFDDQPGVVTDYHVDAVACSADSMAREGGVVLSAPPATDEATQLLAIEPGTPMRLRWSLGWENVFDAIGGLPILVQDGAIVAEACTTSLCHRNPRTALGWTSTGRVLLVVIDGRQSNWSEGVTLVELAHVMQDLGAVQALNLDGGGASTMWVDGEVVNRPSDGHQRTIATSVLILPGKDPGEA